MNQVTLIPGDGIGPEVTSATVEVIEAAGVKIKWEKVEAGAKAEAEFGTPLPDHVLSSMAQNKVALKGPTTTPFGGSYAVKVTWEGNPRYEAGTVRSYPSISVALRKELGLFANVRPAKNYPGIASKYQGIDLVLFRENTEDLYSGLEHMVNEEIAEAIKIISRPACERIAQFAFEYAVVNNRKKVTAVHKSNIMKLTDGMFLKTAQQVAARYSQIAFEDRVVDNMCMQLVQKPELYDLLVLPNLYGDILSDLAAGLVGGLGVAPGANIGEEVAEFEAVHGSAPKYAGQNRVNPMAMILSGVMMLRHLGEQSAADKIDQALSEVLTEGKAVTVDLGGSAGTREMADAIANKVSKLKR